MKNLLTKPEDLKQDIKFKGLIYGQPGIGKSTLALSSPNPVMIDFDGGIKRVEPHLRVPSLQVEDYATVLEFLNSSEVKPFDTIVIDTMGKGLEFMEPYLIKQNPKNATGSGALSLMGYKARKIEFNNLLKLVGRLNKSILFVAHEKEEKNGDEKIIRPDIPGSSGADLIKELDFVGYMEAKGIKRTISFFPTEKYYAKNSLQLDEVIEIPNTKDGNTFIAEKIVKMTKEKLNKQAELIKEYNSTLQSVETYLEGVENPNDAIEVLSNMKDIWDAKKRAFVLLKKKGKELGYSYKNKEFVKDETIPDGDTSK